MTNSPVPVNEKERLKALDDYEILDTLSENEFDRITELASIICDVPISLVSLVDEKRQWFKSVLGLDVRETSRDISFCRYAIMDTNLMEINDTTKDLRFKANALVTGAPDIRFYAGYPLVDPNGHALGTLCVIDREPRQLNAKQKRAMQLLAEEVIVLIVERRKKQQLQSFEKIFNLSNDLVFVGGEDGFFKKINPAFKRVLGWEEDHLLHNSTFDFIHPDDIEGTITQLEKLSKGEPTVNFLQRFKSITGEYRTIQWTSTPEASTGNIFGIGRDVTEKIKLEMALNDAINTEKQLNEELKVQASLVQKQDKTIQDIQEFKFLADSIPEIIWTSNPDGSTDYYNRYWFDYTGLTLEETKAFGWPTVLHPDDIEKDGNDWHHCLATGTPYESEVRFRRKSDGVYRWHLSRALPMKNDKGEVVKWFGSCTDIDEYKRALNLESKISQFEDFNRIIAHNLRGPAGSIGMLLDMVAGEDDAAEKENLLCMLKTSSLTLNETLNELMKVLEVRNNKNMTYDLCYLPEMVNVTDAMLKGQIAAKKATITTDLQISNMKFPKMYLESIFYNMVSNSLKYSKPDVAPQINISSKIVDGRVVLQFSDNGLGIDLSRHGQNMFKLNSVFHTGYDSKGVGLFMTKTQIETFGGKITVESEPNVGTTFTIVF
ncbi:PAS domain S-box protein [Mucilaginibacter sp.]|uniref:PAS domain S-box protein n=1 Tax=Mucilaginibacter sp. TaxID=1882438 RepID=UPI003262D209